VATDASKGLVSVTNTGTGDNVLATSPTLVTPALGTPSALVGTNITGTATAFTASNVTTNANLTGMVTSVGNAASLGSFTSAQLLAALTDETGTGAAVFASSPALTNPTVTSYVESVVAIGTVTSSSTLSLTDGTVQTATLTASTACTFTMPTATAGKSFVLLLKQAASTGNGTATFTSVKFGAAGAPTITATAGKMDILTFIADGTNWYGSAAQGYTP
jgi:hypothetical protein